ncbi:MAG: PAS domain S-box protein [Rhodobacteraceae bacterium]|nr:PAS domain S-box protein [Paracoccaceae bacterium]
MLIFAIYGALGWLEFQPGFVPGTGVPVSPRSGLAIACVILFGPKLFPGLVLGAGVFGGHSASFPLVDPVGSVAFGFAALMGLACLVQVGGVSLSLRFFPGEVLHLRRWRDVLLAVFLAGFLPSAFYVGIAALGVHFLFGASAESVVTAWPNWLLSDFLGVALFAPLVFLLPSLSREVWFQGRPVGDLSWWSYVSVLAPMMLGLVAFAGLGHMQLLRGKERFDSVSGEHYASLVDRFAAYELALDSAGGFFRGSDTVTQAEWEDFVETSGYLRKLPGLSAIGFVQASPIGPLNSGAPSQQSDELGSFGDGVSYSLRSMRDGSRAPVHLGDVFVAAARKSAREGRIILSGKDALPSGRGVESGFWLVRPVFHEGKQAAENDDALWDGVIGWIYAPFSMRRFFDVSPSHHGRDFRVTYQDRRGEDGAELIFSSGADGSEHPFRSIYRVTRKLNWFGVAWTISWNSTPSFEKRLAGWERHMVLLLGAVVAAMAAVLGLQRSRRDDIIAETVAQQTYDVENANRQQRSIFDTAEAGIVLADAEGRVIAVNRFGCTLFGYSGEVGGRRAEALIDGLDLMEIQRLSEENRAAERNLFTVRRGDQIATLSVKVSKWHDTVGQCFYTILAHDVSLQLAAVAGLEENNRRWLSALDGSDIAAFDVDLVDNSSVVTDTWWRIMGLDVEECLDPQSEFLDRIDPRDRETLAKNDAACVKGETQVSVTDFRVRHGSDRSVWIRSHATVSKRASNGQALRLVGTMYDITALKTAEEALQDTLEMFRVALHGAPVGLALVSRDGRIDRVNGALCELVGCSPEEIKASGCSERIVPEDKPVYMEMVAAAMDGEEPSPREFRLRRGDGRDIWVRSALSLVHASTDREPLLVQSFEDVSAERELAQLKSDFVSTVSHELRTPLTAIKGALALVLGTSRESIPGQPLRLIQVAAKNCDHLIYLVNDILDVDKLVAGKMEFNTGWHDLRTVLDRSLEANVTYAMEHEVTFELEAVPPNVEINVDPERIQQVLANLLSNAVKFSPLGESVSISAENTGRGIRIRVRDRGPGIPLEYHQRVFERFVQIEREGVPRKHGTGLGLHISQLIMDRMGGALGLESVPGEGATFWLDLPGRPGA